MSFNKEKFRKEQDSILREQFNIIGLTEEKGMAESKEKPVELACVRCHQPTRERFKHPAWVLPEPVCSRCKEEMQKSLLKLA